MTRCESFCHLLTLTNSGSKLLFFLFCFLFCFVCGCVFVSKDLQTRTHTCYFTFQQRTHLQPRTSPVVTILAKCLNVVFLLSNRGPLCVVT